MGCSRSATGPVSEIQVHDSDGQSMVVRIVDDVPQSVTTVAGETIAFNHGEAVVGERLILAVPSGTAEIFRTPRSVMQEISTLPTVYLRDGTLEGILVETGSAGRAEAETRYGRLWNAYTCTNPGCASQGKDGQPFLFNAQSESAKLPRGARPSPGGGGTALACPLCAMSKFVIEYDPPQSAARKVELLAELKRIRQARDQAAAAQQP